MVLVVIQQNLVQMLQIDTAWIAQKAGMAIKQLQLTNVNVNRVKEGLGPMQSRELFHANRARLEPFLLSSKQRPSATSVCPESMQTKQVRHRVKVVE